MAWTVATQVKKQMNVVSIDEIVSLRVDKRKFRVRPARDRSSGTGDVVEQKIVFGRAQYSQACIVRVTAYGFRGQRSEKAMLIALIVVVVGFAILAILQDYRFMSALKIEQPTSIEPMVDTASAQSPGDFA